MTPGPGEYAQTAYYNASSQSNHPKYQFGKSARSQSTNNLCPGRIK